MKKLLVVFLLVLSMAMPALLPAMGASAATSATVTVTATGQYLTFSNSPATWSVGGITGSGFIAPNTTYYSNPLGDTTAPSTTVADSECRFTITNGSNVNTSYTINWADFSSGDAMTNIGGATPGANAFSAYVWASGVTYSSGKVLCKSSASSAMITGVAPATTSLKWGATITTQTGAWTSASAETGIMTITISAT
jgi:hypothetical protein